MIFLGTGILSRTFGSHHLHFYDLTIRWLTQSKKEGFRSKFSQFFTHIPKSTHKWKNWKSPYLRRHEPRELWDNSHLDLDTWSGENGIEKMPMSLLNLCIWVWHLALLSSLTIKREGQIPYYCICLWKKCMRAERYHRTQFPTTARIIWYLWNIIRKFYNCNCKWNAKKVIFEGLLFISRLRFYFIL